MSSAAVPAADYTPPTAPRILDALRPGHPRLLLDAARLERVRGLVAAPPCDAWLARARAQASKIMEEPVSVYELPDGRRLLRVSRRVMNRVYTLGLLQRLDPDPARLGRLWREVDAAAGFKDWNPSHFLDTAEMTHALAVAYDWFYDDWTPEQRARLRDAIAEKGLKPALDAYRKRAWWSTNENNWNQVCNGGIGLGALALADEEPALCGEILAQVFESLPRAMRHYEPDGAGVEGVTYWIYGAKYNVLFLDALSTALQTDFGLGDVGALGRSGRYPMFLSDASGQTFNFGDCGTTDGAAPQHFWLAQRYGAPAYRTFRLAALRRHPQRADPLDVLWYTPEPAGGDRAEPALPLACHFRGAEVASFRTAWDDPNAWVVALQGGSNAQGHRHLDLGSFILEAEGVRWVVDCGTERETYQTHRNHVPRWNFYRTRAEGHNTPVINPDARPDQSPKASARIDRFETGPGGTEASVDLTAPYAADATSVRRTLRLGPRGGLDLRDTIALKEPGEIWWFLHTRAEAVVRPDGRSVTLRQGGRALRISLAEGPEAARFEVLPAEPLPTSPRPAEQASNEGLHKLALHLRAVTRLDLAVTFRSTTP